MKIEDIIAFTAVVRHQSISRAAEALHLDQSAVTRRVQNLEDSLGIELLNRSTKPPKPSHLGQIVYKQAQAVVQQLEILKSMVSTDTEPSGTFRLGVPQIISESILVDAIRHLKKTFPALSIQITTGSSPILLDAVEDGELDAAAIIIPEADAIPPTVAGNILVDFEMCVVAQKGEFANKPYTLSEIHERGWILNPRECGFRNSLEAALAAKGLSLTLNLDVFGSEVQLGLVASGLGVGLVPERLLKSSSHFRKVEIVEVSDFKLRNRICLVHPAIQGCLASAVAEFGKTVQKNF